MQKKKMYVKEMGGIMEEGDDNPKKGQCGELLQQGLGSQERTMTMMFEALYQ